MEKDIRNKQLSIGLSAQSRLSGLIAATIRNCIFMTWTAHALSVGPLDSSLIR